MTGLKITPAAATPARPGTPPLTTRIAALLQRDFSWRGGRLSDKQKEAIYVELSLLLRAGVDLKAALELQGQQPGAVVQQTLARLQQLVVAGSSLSAALRTTNQFTAYEYFSLQIGEETGQVVAVLEELARFYTRKIKQRRQVTQALAYPVIILGTAVGAVLFMLHFIVPMFSDVFRQFGGKLPPLTQVIVHLSALLRTYWPVGLGSVLLLLLGLRLSRRLPGYPRWQSLLLLRLPIVGAIVKRVYLARLCSSLALLCGAHVPLIQALALSRQMLHFWPITYALTRVEQQVLQGASLHRSLQAFPLFDARMIALLKVGEEVNKLPHFFGLLAQQYSEEVEYRTALLSTALEPLIIIFLGLVVGLILVAMYLPIFQLSSAIG